MFQGKFLFELVGIIFVLLLVQGIREKNKVKIIISSIFLILPLIFLAWLLLSIAYI